MIKTFEQYNETKYVIIIKNDDDKLYVNVNRSDYTFDFGFGFIDDITINDVRIYDSYLDAEVKMMIIKDIYPKTNFNIITFDELEIKMNTNKYNL